MEQILVTVDENQQIQNIRKAINMLKGVISTTVMKEPLLSKSEHQKAYVRESLGKALQEIKIANLQGKHLQPVDEFLKELDEEEYGN